MKLRLLTIAATTALVPAVSLAQTSPTQPAPSLQARPAQPSAQAPAAADFVNRAAVSNMFEIQSSQLVQQKSQNDRVRQFAQQMIQDHTAAGDKLKSTVQGMQGMTVPTSLDQPHQQMMQTLQNASGAGFDRAYVQMQVTAHRNAVGLFDQYAQSGDNQQLKQFAQQTVPALRQHLQMIEQIQNALPPAQVGSAQGSGGQQQAGQDPSRIVVQQSAPTVRVDQASPQVTVQQPQPRVTVNQPQPEILVRQPQPTVTLDIPQPEIIVRMPEPDVNVAMAAPQVEVRQPQPQVQIQQPQQQPQVRVQPSEPQVQVMQQPDGRSNVQVQQAQGRPNVRYERAEPRIVVTQPQGQPQVRFERMGEGQQAGAQGQAGQRQQQAATSSQPAADSAPQATGAVPTGQAITVSRVTDMNLYNARGNELGDVERVVQGQDGKQFVVIGAGGFLGIGERDVAIPTDQIAMQGDRLVVQGLTEDQIRAMPAFDTNNRNFRSLDDNQQVQINPMR